VLGQRRPLVVPAEHRCGDADLGPGLGPDARFAISSRRPVSAARCVRLAALSSPGRRQL
jgi:hypothetical protein